MSAIGVISSSYTGCTQDSLSVSVTTNNQLSSTGFSYDAAGNMLTDNVNSYAWNAESEMKSGAGVTYTYDGDGNRLEKSSGKIYWYGAGTEILDESDLSGNFTNEYVFFGGKRIAIRVDRFAVAHKNVSSGTIDYYEEDMLGSSRTLVQAGATSPCFDADFLPFGYEKDVTTTCSQNYKFEGKERDTETGDDDFGARYYTFRLGRWLSADWSSIPAPVPYANLSNPQTLNLYAMVSDNPESFADLDGHKCEITPPGGISCKPDVPPNAPVKTGESPTDPKSPTQQAQQPTQQPANDQTKRRLNEAVDGAANVVISYIKVLGAAGAASTAETGAGAAAAGYGAITAAGQGTAGVIQLFGAATGNTGKTEEAAEAITSVTSVSGLTTMIATGGDIHKAAKVASIEGILTSNPEDLVSGKPIQRVAAALDLVQTVRSLLSNVKQQFIPSMLQGTPFP